MSSTTSIFAIILSAVLTNNFIFSQFLGCCPFLGCSSKIDTAAGMGLAVTFVMGLASAICWLVNCLLVKLGLGFLQTIAYILVIAALVQFIEMFLKKSVPSLYSALGIYLPLMVSGILTLTLNHSAFFSEILRSGVSAVGHGQLEAARSLGLGTFKTFRLIVFPQAFKTAMPPLTGQFVALLKETVICSVVGIPELLREAPVVQSWTANPTPLIIATIGYLLLLVPLTRLSRYLEVRMSTVRQAC